MQKQNSDTQADSHRRRMEITEILAMGFVRLRRHRARTCAANRSEKVLDDVAVSGKADVTPVATETENRKKGKLWREQQSSMRMEP